MTLEGKGQLESLDVTSTSHLVRYRFEVVQQFARGTQTTTEKRDSAGSVESLTGEPIPLGQYLLRTSDGNAVHVQNDGWYGWSILALDAV